MIIEKIETKTQEVTFLLTLVGSLSVVFTGAIYLNFTASELSPITGSMGLILLDGLFSSLGYSAFFLALTVLHIGRFMINNMVSIKDFGKIYHRLFVKSTMEIGAILILSSVIAVMQNYFQIDNTGLLADGAGGHVGNLIGGVLFTKFGLFGAMTILAMTLVVSLILSGTLRLASLILAAKDHISTTIKFATSFVMGSFKGTVSYFKSLLISTGNSFYIIVFGRINNNVKILNRVIENATDASLDKTPNFALNSDGIILTAEDVIEEHIETHETPVPASQSIIHREKVIEPTPTIEKQNNKKKAKPKPKSKIATKAQDEGDKTESVQQQEITITSYKKRYSPPSQEILGTSSASKEANKVKIKEQCVELEERLSSFGIHGDIIDASVGARLTMYEFKPAQGVRLSKLIGLTDDLALMLGADSIRILAPIPGKTTVGIEVPNKEPKMVMMGDMLKELKKAAKIMRLPIAIGKDVYNNTIVEDIAKMPHMMVSGTTGSGKSVFINNLIVSLLYTQSPKNLRFIMIDPKMIELSPYNGIPHLLKPVVTDLDEAKDALVWAQNEMDRRYQVFAELGARDIQSFNTIINKNDKKFYERKTGKTLECNWEELPQIVIIVDELADLMITQGKDVEIPITRIAQKARAAGIHLIIATQRPSAEVVTGLIKTNFSTRTAFKVSSSIDSRTILDKSGAEKLLGDGDMLFMANGKSISRFQSAYISEEEVRKLVSEIS